MIFDDLISDVAGITELFERAARALAEYGKMSADDFFPEGYTPMEYAKSRFKRVVIRKVFRPCERRYFRDFSCSRSVPGIVRKRCRWVRRGGGYSVGYNRRVSE